MLAEMVGGGVLALSGAFLMEVTALQEVSHRLPMYFGQASENFNLMNLAPQTVPRLAASALLVAGGVITTVVGRHRLEQVEAADVAASIPIQ